MPRIVELDFELLASRLQKEFSDIEFPGAHPRVCLGGRAA
jgi:hypothetical protein